jgi:hypothetical protein
MRLAARRTRAAETQDVGDHEGLRCGFYRERRVETHAGHHSELSARGAARCRNLRISPCVKTTFVTQYDRLLSRSYFYDQLLLKSYFDTPICR